MRVETLIEHLKEYDPDREVRILGIDDGADNPVGMQFDIDRVISYELPDAPIITGVPVLLECRINWDDGTIGGDGITWTVDLPRFDDTALNLGTFSTKAEAIAFVREHIGYCDNYGTILVIDWNETEK